jgi:NAD(P)-dependent dehydrogenase (short-subunit alcohol dehydrogenase family)
MMGEAGAKVVIVARGEEKLLETKAEIEAAGGQAYPYTCDLSDMEDAERLVQQVLADHGSVDVLVNNAGRSIRRSIQLSYDRFHDFERLMQLNYFGSLKLIMGFLPEMTKKRRGHIINISSIGVLSNAPRFSAYVASKSALDAFSRCAASEFADTGVAFTTINMPLVRTPMIAPTKIYDHVPTITPGGCGRHDQAGGHLQTAAHSHPTGDLRPDPAFGGTQDIGDRHEFGFPHVSRIPPRRAARRDERRETKPTQEQVAFASLMRGIHW